MGSAAAAVCAAGHTSHPKSGGAIDSPGPVGEADQLGPHGAHALDIGQPPRGSRQRETDTFVAVGRSYGAQSGFSGIQKRSVWVEERQQMCASANVPSETPRRHAKEASDIQTNPRLDAHRASNGPLIEARRGQQPVTGVPTGGDTEADGTLVGKRTCSSAPLHETDPKCPGGEEPEAHVSLPVERSNKTPAKKIVTEQGYTKCNDSKQSIESGAKQAADPGVNADHEALSNNGRRRGSDPAGHVGTTQGDDRSAVPLFDIRSSVFRAIHAASGAPSGPAPVELDWVIDSSDKAVLAFYVGDEKHRLRQHQSAQSTLPLAPVTGPFLNLSRLKQLAQEQDIIDEGAETMFRFLMTDFLAARHDADILRKGMSCVVSRNFTWEDITTAETFLEEDDSAVGLPAFKVAKSSGIDSRFVTNCIAANDSITIDIPKMRLWRLPVLLQRLLGYNWGFEADGLSFFYQIPVRRALGRIYGVRLCGKRGRFKRYRHKSVPMGAKWAPFTAQEVSRLICELTIRRSGLSDVFFVPWIDNFICGAHTKEEAEKMRAAFLEVAAEVNLKIKEDPQISQVLNILGLEVRLDSHTAHSSEKMKRNIEAVKKLSDSSKELSHAMFLGAFGTCGWANYSLLRTPLCLLPYLMARLRAVCRTQKWGQMMRLSVEEKKELKAWADSCSAAVLSCDDEALDDKECTIAWTDASGEFIAGIKQAQGRDADTFWLPNETGAIYEAELLGEAIATSLWARPKEQLLVVGDNTAAVRALQKGHSSSDVGDRILRELVRQLHSSVSLWTAWTPTHLQRADPLTRPNKVPWQEPHHRYAQPWRVNWRVPHKNGQA